MARVLAISAHYDDVEIACGGSLLKHRDAGDDIFIAVIKSGDDLCGDPIIRQDEQIKSRNILNGHLFCFGKRTNKEIVAELDNINPDVIYIPYCKDTHQDHIEAFEIGKAVARKVGIKRVLQYISPTSFECYPSYFKAIDFYEKEKLIQVFQSQVSRRPDYIEIAKAQNKLFGLLSGFNFAEGFNIIKWIEE
jgi:LmbE family N-acetylglucosaminyl deacetylase